jgi:hypothetical protein
MGLDPQLVQDFIAAGPEASADAVNELANAGQGTIDEVNAIQGDITRSAGAFAEEQAGIYYDAGIASAQGIVDGLGSKLAAIDAEARAIGESIIAAVAPYAEKAKETGTAIGSGLTTGVDDGTGGLADVIGGIIAKLDFSDVNASVGAQLDGLINSFTNRTPVARRSVTDMLREGLRNPVVAFINPFAFLVEKLYDPLISKIPTPSEAYNGVRAVIKGVELYLTDPKVRQQINDKARALFNAILEAIPGASAFFNRLMGLAGAFRGFINVIIGLWNRLDFGIEFDVPNVPLLFGPLSGKRFKINDIFPDVPFLADGGLITRPTLAMVGEKPGVSEAVIPLNRAGLADAFGGLGNGDVYADVNVYLDGELVRGVARVEVQRAESDRARRLTGGRRA